MNNSTATASATPAAKDMTNNTEQKKINSPAQVLAASLIGTTIEFFDFYVYATAAVLVFPTLFFPNDDPTAAILASFATFAIAFFARPFGAVVFGHFGDKIGRKATLIAALLTMGISTVVVGILPGYNQIGIAAPFLLALCRFGQGFGLGGEWGGAVLLATENAPKGKKSLYGIFPQLGAAVGLFLSSGMFFVLLTFMSKEDFISWGWRIPFIASILLVVIGLWVRLSITETPDFQKTIDNQERVKLPIVTLLKEHKMTILLCTFMTLITFVLFHFCAAYLLSYNIKVRGMTLISGLQVQLFGAVLFAIGILISGKLAQKTSRYTVLIIDTIAIALFAFFLTQPLLNGAIELIYVFMSIGMFLFGITYGVLGSALSTAFPTNLRYTGSSITFNLGGMVGASFAPYIATWLQTHFGIGATGYYIAGAALISLLCIITMGKKRI